MRPEQAMAHAEKEIDACLHNTVPYGVRIALEYARSMLRTHLSPSPPQLLPPPAVITCLHKWVHMPERDWVSLGGGSRVELVFYCEHCLATEARVVERSV